MTATFPVPAFDAYAVRCRSCRGEPGEVCTAIFDGRPMDKPHERRISDAALAAREVAR